MNAEPSNETQAIALSALEFYLKDQISTNHGGIVIHLEAAEADVNELVHYVLRWRPDVLIRVGRNVVEKRGRMLQDAATGLPAALLNLSIEASNGESATVVVRWYTSPLSAESHTYNLEKVSRTWVVTKEIGYCIS